MKVVCVFSGERAMQSFARAVQDCVKVVCVFSGQRAVQSFARVVYSVVRELRADEAGCCRFQPPVVRELRVHGSSPRAGGGEVCGEGRGQGLRRLHRLLLPAFQQHAGRCVM